MDEPSKVILKRIFQYIKYKDEGQLSEQLGLCYDYCNVNGYYLDILYNTCRFLDKTEFNFSNYITILNLYRYYNYAKLTKGFDYFMENDNKQFDKLKFLSVSLFNPSIDQINDAVNSLKYTVNTNNNTMNVLAPILPHLAYIDLCSDCIIEHNILIVEDLLNKLTIDMLNLPIVMNTILNLNHRLGPVRLQYNTNNILLKSKKRILEHFKDDGLLYGNKIMILDEQRDDKHILVLMDKPHKKSSDFKVFKSFYKILKSHGYILDVLCEEYIEGETNKLFNKVYQWNPILKIFDSIPKYKNAIIVNHLNSHAMAIVSNNVVKNTVCILGHLITSGVADYFIIPEWDNPENYSEKPILFPGTAGNIPPIDKLDVNHSLIGRNGYIYIAVPLSGLKINSGLGPIWETINDRIKDKSHIDEKCINFLMHMGTKKDAIILQMQNELHIKPYLNNYSITSNSMDYYCSMLQQATIILIPYPYSGYITISSIFGFYKPIITLRDKSRFSSQCASYIMELLGFGDLVANTEEEYINLAVKCCIDKKYNSSIRDRMKLTDYNSIIHKHNKEIKNAITNILLPILDK